MTDQQAYASLIAHLKQSIALSQIAGLLSWDQETMMPPEGAEARAEQSAALATVIHQRDCDPRIAEWCEQIDLNQLDAVAAANVREARRTYERATKIPAKLAEELARQTALGQGIWAKARADENVSDFLPMLENIVALKRQQAACLQSEGGELYDALIDEFEPEMKTADLAELLAKLRLPLAALRQKISSANRQFKSLYGKFDEPQQLEMARRLASVFNYRWLAGRMDKAVHPFSSGYRSDSRITTRVNPDNVFDCMYSTVHEVGHANYEQGRNPSMDLMPAGSFASMGIHESQSRMLENQIGRSRAFMDWLHPQMCEVFGDIGVSSPDELYAAVNVVETGYIRTDADEVHYNLHVMMRFDLERSLFRGDLQVKDLEGAWNERFVTDFGLQVDKPSNGVLQDVHWSCGLFGYFPTYSLGNIYAAELFAAMGKSTPDMDAAIAAGELNPLSDWLRENVHSQGNVYPAQQLMQKICNKPADENALVTYLDDKFGELYDL